MNRLWMHLKRNISVFLRDKTTVFFSFLSTIILVGLYFLFIAKIYVSGMDAMAIEERAKYFLTYIQMIVGVLALNSLSLATGVYGVMAYDFANGKIDSFLLTPVKPAQLIFSYFSAGLICSYLLNACTWLASVAVIGAATGYWVGAATIAQILGAMLLTSLISCGIMMMFTAIVKSPTAIGTFNGVSGTLFGFLCGIYMPYSQLGEFTEKVGSVLPFTHLVVWMKRIVLTDALGQIGVPDAAVAEIRDSLFSAGNVGFAGLSVPLPYMLLYAGLLGLAALAGSALILQKRIRK